MSFSLTITALIFPFLSLLAEEKQQERSNFVNIHWSLSPFSLSSLSLLSLPSLSLSLSLPFSLQSGLCPPKRPLHKLTHKIRAGKWPPSPPFLESRGRQ